MTLGIHSNQKAEVFLPSALPESSQLGGNFITRVQMLVSRIMEQMSRSSESDRKQLETLKREYRMASADSATTQRNMGYAAPVIAMLGVGLVATQFKYPESKELIQFMANQVPSAVGGLYNGHMQGQLTERQGAASLLLQEIQADAAKPGSEANTKQELSQLFNSALQAQQKASSTN